MTISQEFQDRIQRHASIPLEESFAVDTTLESVCYADPLMDAAYKMWAEDKATIEILSNFEVINLNPRASAPSVVDTVDLSLRKALSFLSVSAVYFSAGAVMVLCVSLVGPSFLGLVASLWGVK